MAQHVSAVKRTRRNAVRTDINRARRGRLRTCVKKVETAIAAGDRAAALAAFKTAEPLLQRSVSLGVLPRNTAARKVARMNARIKSMA